MMLLLGDDAGQNFSTLALKCPGEAWDGGKVCMHHILASAGHCKILSIRLDGSTSEFRPGQGFLNTKRLTQYICRARRLTC